MYEPKYKLNRKDEARYRELLTRHCLELGKPNLKYPPLTPAENAEFEALDKKRHDKLWSHPKMVLIAARAARQEKHTKRLLKKLKEAIDIMHEANRI